MSGGELCSIARITGKEECDCSLLSLHIQGFFITTSGQNTLCFPNILILCPFTHFLTHLLYLYEVQKGLSHLELLVLLSLPGDFTLKAVPPTGDFVWPLLALC